MMMMMMMMMMNWGQVKELGVEVPSGVQGEARVRDPGIESPKI